MAVAAISNGIPGVANHILGQTKDPQAANPIGAASVLGGGVGEDRFTPSAQTNSAQETAQAAGIFQLGQVAPIAISPNQLLQPLAPTTNQSAAPVQAAAAAILDSAGQQSAAENTIATPSAASPQAANSNSSQNATSSPGAAAQVQNQIEALNAALPALGLTNEEIQQIDRIAALVHNFNPAAYANLVNQFEALAQQNAPTAAASANSTAPASTVATATGASGGSFQLQGASIQFAGPQGAGTTNAANGGGSGGGNANPSSSASGLQIQQVQFALSSTNGATVNVQAPQQSNVVGNGGPKPRSTQAAAA